MSEDQESTFVKANSTVNSSDFIDDENYIEFDLTNKEFFLFDENNTIHNLFANLLMSQVPSSDYKEKLKEPPYEYYDNRYYLAVVEDRILIYDKDMEIKVLPKLDDFLDLMKNWKIAINKKPKLIRLYIYDDYNFELFMLGCVDI